MLILILVICMVGFVLIDRFCDVFDYVSDIFQGICIIVGIIDVLCLFIAIIGYLDTIHIDEEIKLYEDSLQESIETYGVNSYYYKRNYRTLMQLKEDKIHSKDYKWLLYFGK